MLQDNGFLPLAGVMGAHPANSSSPRPSVNLVRLSPISASTPSTGQHPQARGVGDDFGVWVPLTWAIDASARASGGARGVVLGQQRAQVNECHRVFQHRGLLQVSAGEGFTQPLDVAVEVAFAETFGRQPTQPGRSQFGRLSRDRCGGQDGAGIGAGQPALGQSCWARADTPNRFGSATD